MPGLCWALSFVQVDHTLKNGVAFGIMSDRHVLLIDCMNAYIRAYNAYPTMSSHGHQMGGCIGFLKIIRKIIDETQPKAVYLIWESGGSARRRALYSEYKLGRRPEKMNRFYEQEDIPDSEQNKRYQLIALLGMLKHVPLNQVYVPDCEADDVIAYLCCNKFVSVNKTIVSSDKDFYQLLNDKTRIYSLHKKTFITAATVLDEFRVSASNFALAKALCGDPSDNIPGLKGMGFKTVAKTFPTLALNESLILQELFAYCHTHLKESKKFKQVLDEKENIERNWKLVHLNGSMLSHSQVQRVESAIDTYKPKVDRFAFMRKLIDEGINDFNVESFLYTLNCIEDVNK